MYNVRMEDQDRLAIIIGKNLTRLRKLSNMTQLELAEKLNYSDKSVSKWEQGNGIPDVRILVQLAELFNVSVDDLVREHTDKPVVPKRERMSRRLKIVLLSVGLCWFVAVAAFVILAIIWGPKEGWLAGGWLAFVYAVAASAIVLTVFSSIWHWKWALVGSISLLIWSVLTCLYLTLIVCGVAEGMWVLFILGAVLQVLAVMYFGWRRYKRPKD